MLNQPSMDALGFVEVNGFIAGVVATDAMLKSAQVRLLPWHNIRPGIITLVVEGDLAACRAAVAAGVAAAKGVGQVLGHHVIGRLDNDEGLTQLILGGHTCITRSSKPDTLPAKKEPSPKQQKKSSPTATKPTPTNEPRWDEVLTFITAVTNGRTLSDITARFPTNRKALRQQLGLWVSSGILRKKNTRYRKANT